MSFISTIKKMWLDYKWKTCLSSIDPVNSMMIITGADQSHSKSLLQFLSSVHKYEPTAPVIIFDLGLSLEFIKTINDKFPKYEIRKFQFDKYPSHFDITVNAGEYAWKPIIIQSVLKEFNTSVCWMDAGNLLTESLDTLRKIISYSGIYTPTSLGTIKDWTHPKMLDMYKVPQKMFHNINRNGACISINVTSAIAMDIIEKWVACAMVKECIAPKGSSRNNHRQDQAALTVLINLAELDKNIPEEYYGFLTHQDIEEN